MTDPIVRLAEARLIDMHLDLTVQLERGTGTRPMLYLLAKARARAVEALFTLAKIDPTKADDIRHAQNEVSLYDDMMRDARDMLLRGREADRDLSESDRDEIASFLTTEEAQQAGLTPHTED